MAVAENKYGLTRTIPAEVKRAVRQQCGFGCVICGSAIIQYEHFDPEFAEAKEHAAAGITLLCNRCHGKKTSGWLSREAVAEAIVAPFCRRNGFSFDTLDTGPKPPVVSIGNITAEDVETILEIDGDRVLWVEAPEAVGGPYRISAHFKRQDGTSLFRIIENEWQTPADSWDVETAAGVITIRHGKGNIALVLRTVPRKGLHVDRIDTEHNGWRIQGDIDKEISFVKEHFSIRTSHARFQGAKTAIALNDQGMHFGVGPGAITYISHMQIGAPPNAPLQQTGRPPHPLDFVNPFSIPLPEYTKGCRIFLYYDLDAACPCASGRQFKICHHGHERKLMLDKMRDESPTQGINGTSSASFPMRPPEQPHSPVEQRDAPTRDI